MAPNDLKALLKQQPFDPFRIHLVGGQVFDVRHSENVEVRLSVAWLPNTASNVPSKSETIVVVLRNNSYIDFPPREPSA